MKMVKKLLPLSIGITLGSVTVGAQASGFQLMEQNASGLGNAYSGQAAAAENASTIFFNPAGMTRLPGRQFSVALNAIRPSTEFTDSGASRSPAGLPLGPGGTNGGDAGDWAFVPNAYLSWQLNPSWWVGVGVNVPFGLKTEYDTAFIGRFQSQRSEVKTIDVNPSVAFKISDAVSLGFGISYQKAEVKLDRSTFLGVEARSKIKLDDDQWGFNLGALFNVGPSTRIGVSYRSSMDHDLTGTVIVTGVPVVGTTTNAIRTNAEFPDTISWGIAHQLNPAWEILGDITYTRWSKIKAVPVVATTTSALAPAGATLDTFNFQFGDTYRIGIGANWKWRDDFTWKFGAAYDKSPVEDPFRTTFLPDNDRVWLAIGGKYRMSKQATLDFGYAHLFVKDASINRQRGIGVAGAQGNVIGNYDADVNIASVQFTYSF